MKVDKLIDCPGCKSGNLKVLESEMICTNCDEKYEFINGKPFLLAPDSEIREEFRKLLTTQPKKGISSLYKLFPSQRIWSKKSRKVLKRALEENDPREGKTVMNMGSGSEKFYQKLYKDIDEDIVRIGLPLTGKIDIYGDAMDFPIKPDCIDLLISSSVFEHIKNPELAASELNRICKKGGKIYVEIPFLRAYHMEPIDYQRYTISGIEELFKRHGFELIEKGVCSGTFNAMALIWVDFVKMISPIGLKFISRFFFSWLLHPFKYLDRLFENSKRSKYLACNFYYYGKKIG